jgi:non-specific serine/threonine protein kinase/serine/threonine-protein kinase
MMEPPSPSDHTTPPARQPYANAHLAKVAAALRATDHPSQIGPYHILEPIGEGGMGIVFRAEQRGPLNRIVALKLIKLGMDTRQVIARFESERQALAMMRHPNVASVLDAGETDAGRPYFVMEYVSGESITAFADQHGLTLRQRLELFTQACDAVQHAHQKAIIHRDLKPSNILVTTESGKPMVKVIDFGIAKALSQTTVEKTLFTETGQLVGTPEYMSPEQAEGTGLDVDTRSDVYSLGVILYELLAGALPFDPHRLRSAGYEEIRRVIRQTEPPRPSTRLSQLGGELAQQVALSRNMTLESLEKQLHGELDWIPLMALRKDRARRYATPSELSDDIANYLAHRPIRAAPESRLYRARQFILRNKTGVAASAAMVLLLITGTIATTYQAIRATRAQRQAHQALEDLRRQKDQTDRANKNLWAVNDFLTRDVLQSSTPQVMLGRPLQVVEALDNASRTIVGRFNDSPQLRAQIETVIADAYRSLGRADLAMPHAQTAMDVCARSLKPEDRESLDAAREVALIDFDQGKIPEAEALERQLLDRARRSLPPNDELTLAAWKNLAQSLMFEGRLDEADTVCRDAIEAARNARGPDDPMTLDALAALGQLRVQQGRLAEAETIGRQLLDARRRTLTPDHPETLEAESDLGGTLETDGKLAEAEAMLLDAATRARRVFGESHFRTLAILNNLAETYQLEGKVREAEPLYREALEKSRRVLGDDHDNTVALMNNLSRLLSEQDRFAEAEPLYREAIERGRKVRGADHPNVLITELNFGRMLVREGKLDEAAAIDREALAIARKKLGDDHRITTHFMQDMGRLLHRQGRDAEAEPLLRECLERRRRALGDQNPETVGALHELSGFLMDQHRYADAEPIASELYQRSAAMESSPVTVATNMSDWGICLTRLGRFDQAQAPLLEAHRRLEAARVRKSRALTEVLEALAQVADHTNRPADAQQWRSRLASLQATTTHRSATTAATSP